MKRKKFSREYTLTARQVDLLQGLHKFCAMYRAGVFVQDGCIVLASDHDTERVMIRFCDKAGPLLVVGELSIKLEPSMLADLAIRPISH